MKHFEVVDKDGGVVVMKATTKGSEDVPPTQVLVNLTTGWVNVFTSEQTDCGTLLFEELHELAEFVRSPEPAANENAAGTLAEGAPEKLKVDDVVILPDGSGCGVLSLPLPKDHWIYGDASLEDDHGYEPPLAPFRMGKDDPLRTALEPHVAAAARFAVRGATMKGTDDDIDPDALVTNVLLGLFGYWTEDGHGTP